MFTNKQFNKHDKDAWTSDPDAGRERFLPTMLRARGALFRAATAESWQLEGGGKDDKSLANARSRRPGPARAGAGERRPSQVSPPVLGRLGSRQRSGRA